ncbi:MAG: oxygen-independent coproporphyrinogen III oxidase [Pseudomonadales bacterium]
MDSTLIRKYDTGGPCYTSYPTAARFQQPFDVHGYLCKLQQQCSSIAPLSLYIHIPFCVYDFHYCTSTHEVSKDQQKAQTYLDHLTREIELQATLFGTKRPVTQLQWGGGMASYLTPAEMTELMHRTASHFNLLDSPNREYTIEIDPLTADKEKLALLKGLGFNHIRVAIQDFDCALLPIIETMQDLCDMVRGYAFDTLSFELVYGHPQQSIDAFRQTLQQLVDLGPDRIMLQDYTQAPARFPEPQASERNKFCGAERQMSLRIMACQTFVANGYVLIGMHHFVRPHDALCEVQKSGELRRNLQGYSACFANELLGVGVSALSNVGDFYTQNECLAADYYQRLSVQELPIVRGFHLSDEDKMRRYVIMQIICNLRLDFTELLRRFDVVFVQYFSSALPKLAQMSEDGLLHVTNDELRVTKTGRFVLRNICMLFDACIVPEQELVQSQMR